MNQLPRLRPSPAMVVACIALSVALGGTSYAAIKLPKNSVGTKQLKKNAVIGPKLKANAVTGAKVAGNSLTGADVNEATLGAVPSAANATNATTAANAANADTLDGLDSVNVLPGGTLPTGKTIRGNWIAGGMASAGGDYFYESIPFGYALAAAPTAHLQAPAAPPTPQCPGSLNAPSAASGHLCFYTYATSNVSTRYACNPLNNLCGASQANPYGTTLLMISSAAGLAFSWGTWAVTG
jgi:hypothetical protein